MKEKKGANEVVEENISVVGTEEGGKDMIKERRHKNEC